MLVYKYIYRRLFSCIFYRDQRLFLFLKEKIKMKKTNFVESEDLRQMQAYKPYVETKKEKREVKYTLLDGIKEGLGDKWYRIKEGTRQTFDMICFLGAELGFFYAGDTYLAERHNITDRTIRNRFKELVELGLVVKIHRRAKRCNGKGKPIYLFVHHPYFTYWTEFLGLNLDNFLPYFHTGDDKSPCESKKEEVKQISTYSLTKKQESNNNISDNTVIQYIYNRVQDAVNKGTTIKYLSSYINRVVTSLEKQALYAENMRQNAIKKKVQREQSQQIRELTGVKKTVPPAMSMDIFKDIIEA